MSTTTHGGGIAGALARAEDRHAKRSTTTSSTSSLAEAIAPKPDKAPKSKVQVKDKPNVFGSIVWTLVITLAIAGLLLTIMIYRLYAIDWEEWVPLFVITGLILTVILAISIVLIRVGAAAERRRKLAHDAENPPEDTSVELVTVTTRTESTPASAP